MRNLPDSTYDVYERFKLWMHAKQECVLDTVFLTHVYLSVCNQTRGFINRSGSCFDVILFTISTSMCVCCFTVCLHYIFTRL